MPKLSAGRLLRNTLLICVLVFVNKFGNAGAAAFFGILTVMIVRSPSAAFLALMLSGLGLVTNTAIVPKNAVWTIARLAILFVCLARFTIDLVQSRGSLVAQPYFIALILFSAAAATCSLVSGYFVHIALLKLVSFTVGMTALFGGLQVLRHQRVDLTPWFMSITAVIAINGVLMLVMGAGYGLLADGNPQLFFKGPFYHANACGPVTALLGVLLVSTWLYGPHRGRWICLAVAVPLLAFIWLSRSRTGALSFVVGLTVVFLLTYMPAAKRFVRGKLTMSRGSLAAAAAGLALVAVMFDLATQRTLARSIQGFFTKYAMDAEGGSVLSTRQALIESSWQQFLERPLFGLGFQVSLDPYFVENASFLTAPVEKGFLPTAVLEEVGIFGGLPFVLFLSMLVGSLWRRRNAVGLAMLLTYLLTNLGEVTLFAFGGSGLFCWTLVAAGILIGDQCVVPRQPQPVRPVLR
jgi:O-antigen ligase